MGTRIHTPIKFNHRPLTAGEVKYLVIHYTAGNYERAKHIFEHPEKFHEVSVQFVLDIDGTVDEVIPTLGGSTFVANHCGASYWIENGEFISGFNQFSIGVEIVNCNGNLIPYTEAQYISVISLVKQLQSLYPALKSPTALLGHDHIAGFRGKIDLGIHFDWKRVFEACYGAASFAPMAAIRLPDLLLKLFEGYLPFEPVDNKEDIIDFWRKISATMESAITLLNNGISINLVAQTAAIALNPLKIG